MFNNSYEELGTLLKADIWYLVFKHCEWGREAQAAFHTEKDCLKYLGMTKAAYEAQKNKTYPWGCSYIYYTFEKVNGKEMLDNFLKEYEKYVQNDTVIKKAREITRNSEELIKTEVKNRVAIIGKEVAESIIKQFGSEE